MAGSNISNSGSSTGGSVDAPEVAAEVPEVTAEVPVLVAAQENEDTVILTEAVKPRHEVTVEATVQEEPKYMEERPARCRLKKWIKPRSYTVQFMALRKPVDLQYFTGLTDISVTYCPDAWYRYTWITTTDSVKAARIRKDLVNKGYTDAFIRRKSIVPHFTIQVMAVPGPVTDLTRFSNLPEISVRREATNFAGILPVDMRPRMMPGMHWNRSRSLGYKNAFVGGSKFYNNTHGGQDSTLSLGRQIAEPIPFNSIFIGIRIIINGLTFQCCSPQQHIRLI